MLTKIRKYSHGLVSHDPVLGIGEVEVRGGLGRAGWACGFGPPLAGRAVHLDDRLGAGGFLRSGGGFCLCFKGCASGTDMCTHTNANSCLSSWAALPSGSNSSAVSPVCCAREYVTLLWMRTGASCAPICRIASSVSISFLPCIGQNVRTTADGFGGSVARLINFSVSVAVIRSRTAGLVGIRIKSATSAA